MKTVTGRVISAEPISVSKAASILSKFAFSKNAATQAVDAYLQRASAAFNELKGLHRDLKSSSLKEKKPRSDVTLERNPTLGSDEPGRPDDVNRGICVGIQKKKHKKEKSGGFGDLVESGGEIGGGESETVRVEEPIHGRVQASQVPSQNGESERKEGKKKKKKNKENREEDENIDDGKLTTKVETEGEHTNEEKKEKKKKKKKKRKSDGEMGSEDKKSKKKRKVKELDS